MCKIPMKYINQSIKSIFQENVTRILKNESKKQKNVIILTGEKYKLAI